MYGKRLHMLSFVLLGLLLPPASVAESAFVLSHGSILFQVDLLSGAARQIGVTDPCTNIGGMASGPDGRIYAIGWVGGSPGWLCTIDTGTGAGTVIGSLGLPAPAPSHLELTIDASSGQFWAASADGLYEVDGLTGAATFLSPLAGSVTAIAARGGRLYAFTSIGIDTYRLESIDPGTFALTPLFGLPALAGFPSGAAFDGSGHLWFVGRHASLLNVGAFGFYRVHDIEVGGVTETYRGSFFALTPEAGMQDLAFRGAASVDVPILSRKGLVGLTALLLLSALLRLRAGAGRGLFS